MDWRLEVEDNCHTVEALVSNPRPEGADKLQALHRALVQARRMASHEHGPSGFVDWWQGSAIERAWRETHRAEALVPWVVPDADLDAELLAAVGHAREVPADDPARVAVEALAAARVATPERPYVEGDRAVLASALSAAHHASNDKHAAVRDLRNRLLVSTALLVLVAVVLALIGALRPAAVPLCVAPGQATSAAATTASQAGDAPAVSTGTCPTGPSVPSGGDIVLVELFGVLGAALTAAASLGRARPKPSAYRLDWPQWILQLAAGAITALVGVLVLQHSVLPGLAPLATSGQVLVYALVFGAAQRAVTRLVDSRAQTVLAAATSTPAPDAGSGDTAEG